MLINLFKKISALLMIVIMLSAFVLRTPGTKAFFTDIEYSENNTFVATSLDFQLVADVDWEVDGDYLTLGSMASRSVEVENLGNLIFDYGITSEFASGSEDFCNILELSANKDNVLVYEGFLMNLDTASQSFNDQGDNDNWNFEVTLPSSASEEFESAVCEFDLSFKGWQPGYHHGVAYYDTELLLTNRLEAAESFSTDVSPIQDSYVTEEQNGANFGSDEKLIIKTHTDADIESFIKFDFTLPNGSIVHDSKLKLFMTTAPESNRTYTARRALADWEEGAINWNNKPSADNTLTDAVLIDIASDQWINWDVTYDVQNFALGTPNYGWMLRDITENWEEERYAEFVSRNSNDISHHPVLEISFTPVVASTSHIVINEVMYQTSSGSDDDNEWIELYNPANSPVDLTGWSICDGNACDVIPSGILEPKSFAVLSPDASTWNTYWPEILERNTITIEIGDKLGNGLADTGESVILKDDTDAVVDAISYGADTSYLDPSIEIPPKKGKSLARIVKGYDTDTATDWIINATPNPGTNPSESGMETFRITSEGVEVADYEEGLDPLEDEDKESVVFQSVEGESDTSTSDSDIDVDEEVSDEDEEDELEVKEEEATVSTEEVDVVEDDDTEDSDEEETDVSVEDGVDNEEEILDEVEEESIDVEEVDQEDTEELDNEESEEVIDEDSESEEIEVEEEIVEIEENEDSEDDQDVVVEETNSDNSDKEEQEAVLNKEEEETINQENDEE